jgi:hypothetical protein
VRLEGHNPLSRWVLGVYGPSGLPNATGGVRCCRGGCDNGRVIDETRKADDSAARLLRCLTRIAEVNFTAAHSGNEAWHVLTGGMRNDDELRRKAMRIIVEAARLTEAERAVLWATLDLNDDHRILLKNIKDAKYLEENNGLA